MVKIKKKMNVYLMILVIVVVAVVVGIYVKNQKVVLSPDEFSETGSFGEPEPYGCPVGSSGPACCVCNAPQSNQNNLALNEYCSLTDAQTNCPNYCSTFGGVKEVRSGPCVDTNTLSTTTINWCCRCPNTPSVTKQGHFALATLGLNTLCGCQGSHTQGAC